MKSQLSRRETLKRAMQAGAYVAPVVISSTVLGQHVAAVSPTPTAIRPTPTTVPIIPAACTRPLSRELATMGTGTAGTTQTTSNCGSGFIQTFNITLTGAPANTSYDVYLDQESIGSAASHLFAGTFTTDASGNASFTSSITVPAAVTILDNEVVLHDTTRSNFTEHQFIQDSFAPCPVPCPVSARASNAAVGGTPANLTGSGTKVDAPHR